MQNIAVFVSSCDRYSDLWDGFYALFFKYWPDCQLPVYHVSDSRKFEHPRVASICPDQPGRRYNWSGLTKWALGQIPEEYILFSLDDYFLIRPVDTALLGECFEAVRREGASYLRLTPNPPPPAPLGGYRHIGVLPKNTPWRTSLQVAIWKKEALWQLLDEKENQWEYEHQSVHRADCTDDVYLSLALDEKSTNWQKNYEKAYYPILHYNATHMGKWDRQTLAFCRKKKIPVDCSARPIETPWKGFYKKYYLKEHVLVDHLLDFVNHRFMTGRAAGKN